MRNSRLEVNMKLRDYLLMLKEAINRLVSFLLALLLDRSRVQYSKNNSLLVFSTHEHREKFVIPLAHCEIRVSAVFLLDQQGFLLTENLTSIFY